MKKIIWIGSSLRDLQACPEKVKDDVGYALYVAQLGEMPIKAKLLKGLSGVFEIKADYKGNTYRTIYAVKLGESIYVLHVFKKKSHKGKEMPKTDMQTIKSRLMFAQQIEGESK